MTKRLSIRYRRLEDLRRYERNARTHSAEQLEALVASLCQFGWTNPILLDGQNGIIAGHGRLDAAELVRQRGLTVPNHEDAATAPTIDLSHLSAEQRRAYVIADNKLAERAGWDRALLVAELAELREIAVDLDALGFTPADLSDLLAPPAGDGGGEDNEGPEEFREFGEDIKTEHCCPSCGYRWSGKSNAGGGDE